MTTKLEMNYVPAIDYCEAVIDGTHDSPKQVEDGRKLVTSKNIVGGKLDLENCYNISEEDFEQINKRSEVYQWDILMSMIGTVGEICILKDEPDYAIKNVGVFRARNESDAKWLYYYLTSPNAQYDIYARLRGSTQKFLPLSELRSFPILKPENEEIKSKIINQLFSIDCLISCKERLNEKVSELISTLFRSWFIDFDPVKAKAEGKLPYGIDEETAALFPDSFEDSELGPIPTGWRVSPISEICKMSSGGTPSRSKEEYFSTQGVGYPWLASRELNGNIIHDAEEYISELGLKNSSAKLFPENSVAMAMYGATAGRIGYFAKPLTTSQAICVMLAKENICLSKYLYFLIGSESWKIVWMNAIGGAQPNISQQSIGKHRIVLPPFEIIQKFESLVEELFSIIDTSSIQSEKLAGIRDALMPRLMSGELSVS